MFQSIKSKIYIIITLTTLIFAITIFFLMSTFYSINVKDTNEICNHKMEYYALKINSIIDKTKFIIKDFAVKELLFSKYPKQLNSLNYNIDTSINNDDIVSNYQLLIEYPNIEDSTTSVYSYSINLNSNKNPVMEKNFVGTTDVLWYKHLKDRTLPNNPFSFSKPYKNNIQNNDISIITIGYGIFDNDNKLLAIAVGNSTLDSIINKIKLINITKHCFILFADKKNDSIWVSTYKNDYNNYIGESLKDLSWYNPNLKDGDTFILDNVKYVSFSRELSNNMILYINIPTNELYYDLSKIIKYITIFTIFILVLILFIIKLLFR